MAAKGQGEKEFTVSADKITDNKREYYRRKGFFYYAFRWIPLLVIAVVVGLLIAHYRGYPVYDKILTPAMIKLGIPVPEEEGAEGTEPAPPPAIEEPVAEPPPGVDPGMNLPLPGEINED